MYGPIRRQDLESMTLELTLWDLDRTVESSNHFMGEVISHTHYFDVSHKTVIFRDCIASIDFSSVSDYCSDIYRLNS